MKGKLHNMESFVFNDGGRKEAGYLGEARDCVVRAIAIVFEKPYQEVYDALKIKGHSPRNGVNKRMYKKYLESIGAKWTPTMKIGSGCKVHLKATELPEGRLVVRTSRHLTAVINGVINDTYDPSRGGTRCVYGYWQRNEA